MKQNGIVASLVQDSSLVGPKLVDIPIESGLSIDAAVTGSVEKTNPHGRKYKKLARQGPRELRTCSDMVVDDRRGQKVVGLLKSSMILVREGKLRI